MSILTNETLVLFCLYSELRFFSPSSISEQISLLARTLKHRYIRTMTVVKNFVILQVVSGSRSCCLSFSPSISVNVMCSICPYMVRKKRKSLMSSALRFLLFCCFFLNAPLDYLRLSNVGKYLESRRSYLFTLSLTEIYYQVSQFSRSAITGPYMKKAVAFSFFFLFLCYYYY